MGINLLLGRDSPDESHEGNYDAVRKLLEIFESKFGSTNCKQLTGCDLGTAEGQAAFAANNQIEQCTRYVEEATSMALALVGEQ